MTMPNSLENTTSVRCADCEVVLSDRTAESTCAACGGLLVVQHRPTMQGADLRTLFDKRAAEIGTPVMLGMS